MPRGHVAEGTSGSGLSRDIIRWKLYFCPVCAAVKYCTVENAKLSIDTNFKGKKHECKAIRPRMRGLCRRSSYYSESCRNAARVGADRSDSADWPQKTPPAAAEQLISIKPTKPTHFHRHAPPMLSINSHPGNTWSTNTSSSHALQHLTCSLSPACSLNPTADPGSAIAASPRHDERHLG